MRCVVVYESMYGNTRAIAHAIAEGLSGDTVVMAVGDTDRDVLVRADLVVVDGPTHMFGLSRP
jgi:flavodoxin